MSDTPSPSPTTTAPARCQMCVQGLVVGTTMPCSYCDGTGNRRLHAVAPPAPTVEPRDEPQHEGKTAKSEPAAPNQQLEPGLKREGSWPQDCPQRRFVEGAAWWQFHANGATAFPSERDQMEAEAVRRFGEPR